MANMTHYEAAEILFHESARLFGQAQFGLATCDSTDGEGLGGVCEICTRDRRYSELLLENMKRLRTIMEDGGGASPVTVPMDVGDFHDLSDSMSIYAAKLYPDLSPDKLFGQAERESLAA
jgi:hypothetical protein